MKGWTVIDHEHDRLVGPDQPVTIRIRVRFMMLYVQCMYKWFRMGTTKVNFRLPEDLLEKADVAAEITHKNRTEILVEALDDYLRAVEDEDEFKEAVVELYLDEEIAFETLKRFIGRQDAESVRASKTLLDQGEDLADELAELS